MFKKGLVLIGLMMCISAWGQVQKIPALEALRDCNPAAMPKAPVKLGNGLVAKRIEIDKGRGEIFIKMTFNIVARDPENQAQTVKRITGYDFTDLDSGKYGIDEADGAPYITCRIKTKR